MDHRICCITSLLLLLLSIFSRNPQFSPIQSVRKEETSYYWRFLTLWAKASCRHLKTEKRILFKSILEFLSWLFYFLLSWMVLKLKLSFFGFWCLRILKIFCYTFFENSKISWVFFIMNACLFQIYNHRFWSEKAQSELPVEILSFSFLGGLHEMWWNVLCSDTTFIFKRKWI